ncbi:glycoside hydrolase family 108 protein [Acinetobacter radioresistens]|uniref:glycoside hydrolase family 108 protein n=1 Tax=Acinetobacter radioresistens TaxID=40216 RepID=UPI0020053D78|nr:glycoside hydrolase family 108 protein [Acinetobacter radioresistens]
MTFEQAFERLIGHEAGYTNLRSDPGNWTGGVVGKGQLKGTKYGIAANTYPHIDIKNLTLAEAKEIYRRDWWEKLGAEQLHSAIVFQLWDFAVNAGKSRAIKELQQVAGVPADGIIGPKTIAAVNAMDLNDVLLTLTAERLKFYTDLSTFKTFGKGWVRRVADNLVYAAKDN